MNTLFVMRGCPFCDMAKIAVIFLNQKLPPGQQIDIVDIFDGDPRNAIMAELFGDDMYEWRVPVLVIERDGIRQVFDSFIPAKEHRMLFHSVSGWEHYYKLLLNILK